ncbi:DMT family transporter [Mycolicibacterium sp. HK-90]|uniref:DMT family transporter n=1 Tax=Mycolicibacterium sp. HK-90 TaxID=3056937 RepID=UPI00265AD01C|nr:DMT family transporter [Mycolicibacterium sp. HK-90]WKG05729.1 DMT family transporter [Mycolicibacterium sp. HK-90]
MPPNPMPMRTATTVTFFYALGYPIGNLAVHALSPMAVLVVRFGLAGLVLGTWAGVARVGFPTGRKLFHVAVAGLLMQAVQFCALYIAIQHGAPAVLCAVVIAMNPVATALLAAMFLRDRLTPRRVVALVLGVAAVLTACATRLVASGGIDPVVGLLLVALLGLAAGGVYQQRFCSDVDFRASTSVQNAVAFIPALALALSTPLEVHDATKAVLAVAGVVLLNAILGVSLYVRAINLHGASAVAMLFCVIPAVAGVLSWLMLGERVDIGITAGLVLGAIACWLNASGTRSERGLREERQHDPADDGGRKHRVDPVHDAAVAGQ